jgi:hypothetical protein
MENNGFQNDPARTGRKLSNIFEQPLKNITGSSENVKKGPA